MTLQYYNVEQIKITNFETERHCNYNLLAVWYKKNLRVIQANLLFVNLLLGVAEADLTDIGLANGLVTSTKSSRLEQIGN